MVDEKPTREMREVDELVYRPVATPNRLTLGAIVVGLVVALLGSAALFVVVLDLTRQHGALICTFGLAESSNRVEQRAQERPAAFVRRVKRTEEFLADLRDLQDCDPPIPAVVRLSPDGHETIEQARERARERRGRQGGGALQSGGGNPNPGQLPPPPSGGAPPSKPSPPRDPPRTPAPADPLEEFRPVIEPVCGAVPAELHVEPVC